MRENLLYVLTLALFVLGSNLTNAQSFADNIVSKWTFDDQTATDVIGGATGTVVGDAATFIDGISGKAIDFSSFTTGDLAGVVVKDNGSNLNAINFTSESFTVSLWTIIDPSLEEQMLVIKGTNGADATDFDGNPVNAANGHRFVIETKTSELRFALDDDAAKTQLGVNIADLSFAYPSGEWVNMVAVRDRALDSLYLYLNGQLIGEKWDETGDLNIAGQDFVIGNYVTGANVTMGPIDEVMIMNKALSADEVLELYNNPTSKYSPKSAGALSIYPNTVSSDLNIQNASDLIRIDIYNIAGSLVKSVKTFGSDVVNEDVSGLPNGTYIVRGSRMDNSTVVAKFIKQ